MTAPQPPCEHECDTCKNERCPLFASPNYKPSAINQYYSIRWVIGKVGCASHSSRPHTPVPVPNSHELSEMAKTEWHNREELSEVAKTEWHNREERRGIHNREDWCSGWISGFLTPNKPDWTKEREAAIRNATLTNILEKIEYRFNDTERGRRIIETCREIIESLRGEP